MSSATATAQKTSASPKKEAIPTVALVLPDKLPHGAVTEQAIRLCAYTKWEKAGSPSGDGLNFWLEAEKELRKSK